MDARAQSGLCESRRCYEKGAIFQNRARPRRTGQISQVERSPRRQVVGSNPASPKVSTVAALSERRSIFGGQRRRYRFMLSAGIVGLPNVGKSTLFNAVTRTHKAPAENYPFCTIDPNVGVVTVPDRRLAKLAAMSHSQKIVPTAIDFVDIAGLVKGASTGEGLGNQFLSHIREVDAIVEVVRCFASGDVHHVAGAVDPARDIEVINTELVLADLASLEKRRDRIQKEVRAGSKAAKIEDAIIEKLLPHLNQGRRALTLDLPPEEKGIVRDFFLLTST